MKHEIQGEKTKKAVRKKARQKERQWQRERGAGLTQATFIRPGAQAVCPSAQIVSNLHQNPRDARPGRKSSWAFKWCRKREVCTSGVEEKLIWWTHRSIWVFGTWPNSIMDHIMFLNWNMQIYTQEMWGAKRGAGFWEFMKMLYCMYTAIYEFCLIWCTRFTKLANLKGQFTIIYSTSSFCKSL